MIEVLNAYHDRNTIVVLTRENGAVNQRRFQAEYIAWLTRVEGEKVEAALRRRGDVVSLRWDGDWLRVGFRDRDVREAACNPQHERTGGWLIRNYGCAPMEADLSPLRLWLAETEIAFVRPRRAWLDIEVDPRRSIKDQTEGLSRVLLWALEVGGEVIQEILEDDTDEAERALLGAFWRELEAFDQVVAWNGDYYDFLVMFSRSQRLGIHIDPRRWIWLDYLPVFRRMNMSASESGDEKQSMALHAVATSVLGYGKDDFDYRRIYDVWKQRSGPDFDKLCRYNAKDAALMPAIEAKSGYLELHQTICEVCNVISDTRGANPQNFFESYMLRLGRAKGVRFPSRWRVDTFEQFAGAYVMEPTKRGIIRDVHVFDFSAMYPSIMISWNMSPETFAGIATSATPPPGHCLAPGTNALFRTDQEGLLPHALKSMMEKRKQWNDAKERAAPGTEEWKDADRRSTAMKVCVNSCYGVSGAQTSRLYRREVAESTTQVGVWLIKQTIAAAEDRGYTPFYSDTDSGFVVGVTEHAFREFVGWCNDMYYGELTASLGLRENRIKVAYEKAFSILLMVGKKRYAAKFAHYKGKRAVEDSKAEIKGLEFKRGDTARLARQLQFIVITRLLADAPVEEMHALVQAERRRIFETKLSFDDVKVSKTLKRDPRMYTAVKRADGSDGLLPPHVRAANQLIEAGETVNEGSRVAYVVVDAGAPTTELVPESQYTGQYDCHYLWENLVYPPTMRLLEACFPAVNWRGYLHTRPPASSRVGKNQLSLF